MKVQYYKINGQHYIMKNDVMHRINKYKLEFEPTEIRIGPNDDCKNITQDEFFMGVFEFMKYRYMVGFMAEKKSGNINIYTKDIDAIIKSAGKNNLALAYNVKIDDIKSLIDSITDKTYLKRKTILAFFDQVLKYFMDFAGVKDKDYYDVIKKIGEAHCESKTRNLLISEIDFEELLNQQKDEIKKATTFNKVYKQKGITR